jgi:hypothetical protein
MSNVRSHGVLHGVLWIAGLLVVLLASPLRASAMITVNVPAGVTQTVVGVKNGSSIVAGFRTAAGVCSTQFIAGSFLPDNLTINGTDASESIVIVASTTQFCGATWTVPNRLNKIIIMEGRGGDDFLSGYYTASGGDGNDVMYCGQCTVPNLQQDFGGAGNDFMIIGAGDNAWAGTGNDTVCVFGGTVAHQVSGGENANDFDVWSGQSVNVIEMESFNPAACAF